MNDGRLTKLSKKIDASLTPESKRIRRAEYDEVIAGLDRIEKQCNDYLYFNTKILPLVLIVLFVLIILFFYNVWISVGYYERF